MSGDVNKYPLTQAVVDVLYLPPDDMYRLQAVLAESVLLYNRVCYDADCQSGIENAGLDLRNAVADAISEAAQSVSQQTRLSTTPF